MFVDEICESKKLLPVKSQIEQLIENYKNQKNIVQASVYLRDFNQTAWISINSNENYLPGSLFKVPILVCFLKMNELHPGILDKKIRYTYPFESSLAVAFQSKSIKLGSTYSIRELLKYMIVYSDNQATMLLNQNIDDAILKKIFNDLNLQIPDIKAPQYFFTVNQYSKFMRAIYNGCYLTHENSEYAAKLLSQTVFREGIQSPLPNDIVIAHKFGETGNLNEIQLHESAIVYLDNRPYLLTIMTKGKDNKSLSALISDISKIVFSQMHS